MPKLSVQDTGCILFFVGFLFIPTGVLLVAIGSRSYPCHYLESKCLGTHPTVGIVVNSAVIRDDFVPYFETLSSIKINARDSYGNYRHCTVLTYAGDNETDANSSLLQVNLRLDINYNDKICSFDPIYVTRYTEYRCSIAGYAFLGTFLLFVLFMSLFTKKTESRLYPDHASEISETSEPVQDNDQPQIRIHAP